MCNTYLPVIALISFSFLQGCSGEIHRKSGFAGVKYLSVDARQRLITSRTVDVDDDGKKEEIVCSEPSPNAFVATAAAAAAGRSQTVGNASSNTSIGFGSTEAASALGARTQTIELIRDAYFRACEGYANKIVSQQQYQAIVANVDSTMIALAAVDALGGATLSGNNSIVAGGVQVTPGTDAKGAATVTVSAGGAPAAGQVASNTKLSAESAKALRDIAIYSLSNARVRTDRISAAWVLLRVLRDQKRKLTKNDIKLIKDLSRELHDEIDIGGELIVRKSLMSGKK